MSSMPDLPATPPANSPRRSRAATLSPLGQAARTHDPDRFLISLFAPASLRENLFLLIAFNHELVRALEMPSARSGAGPIAALIRLQWWREVVEGEPRRHELAEPLSAMLAAGIVSRDTLLSIIDAREAEAEGIETLDHWHEIQLGGPGGMQVAFAEALGERDPASLNRFRAIGAAYSAGAILRHYPAILQAGRCPVPEDLLHRAGTSREALLGDEGAGLDPVLLLPLRDAGRTWLIEAGRFRPDRQRIAACLAAVLARRDLGLKPGSGSGTRGLGDRVALIAAWLRGSP